MLPLNIALFISMLTGASTPSQLTQSCSAFVASITQTPDRAQLGFFPDFCATSSEGLLRKQWNFLPLQDPRNKTLGIRLDQISADEQKLVNQALQEILSADGFDKVQTIREHDQFLFDNPQWIDPRFKQENYGRNQYSVAIFGRPSAESTWMFRLQGHHLSINATIADDHIISVTPLFFGEYPHIKHLHQQEDAARNLAILLNARASTAVNIEGPLPRRIYLLPENKTELIDPRGISFSELKKEEADLLDAVIFHYVGSLSESVRAQYLTRFADAKKNSPQNIFFYWIGKLTPQSPLHFYIQIDPGIGLVLEHQNLDGRHIHSVLRDYQNDFGDAGRQKLGLLSTLQFPSF